MLDRASRRRPLPPGVFRKNLRPRACKGGIKRDLRSNCSAAGWAQGGQWHVQRVNEAARLVSQLDLAFKLLAEGLDQARAEAPLSGRLDHGAIRLSPNQTQTLRPGIKRPSDGDAAGRHRQCAELRG